tara:strand:+ start:8048 stop:8530 length:483 start_codon:yes stop_codon:yes gene_type:complete
MDISERLLAEAESRAAARESMGEIYPKLCHASLQALVDECGGQKQAAKVITDYYGTPCSQGTISKALSGNPSTVRDRLRYAIHGLSHDRRSIAGQTAMINLYNKLPTYHDIIRRTQLNEAEYGLYIGSVHFGDKLAISCKMLLDDTLIDSLESVDNLEIF